MKYPSELKGKFLDKQKLREFFSKQTSSEGNDKGSFLGKRKITPDGN